MNLVIGSGPAGVSCAMALLQANQPITMIDSGTTLEPDRLQALQQLQTIGPEQWTSPATDFLHDGMRANADGILLKRAFGSDYPYRVPLSGFGLTLDGADFRPSFSQGGFSSVWGGVVLPHRDEDIQNWPVRVAELAPHYSAVAQFMPIASGLDRLSDLYPLYSDRVHRFEHSPQAKLLLSRWDAASQPLATNHIRFGSSRVAFRTQQPSGDGCAYCGLCMYGCPRGLIYNSADTLQQLRSSPNFRYIDGLTVDAVHEDPDGVHLCCRSNADGSPTIVRGKRAFLACGVLNTARMALAQGWVPEPRLTLSDSQYFLLPLLTFRGAGRGFDQHIHTLAQMFLEILDHEVSPYTVHLQLYTYSSLMREALLDKVGPLAPIAKPFANSFLSRLVMVQGYLHSDHSDRIDVSLRPDGDRTLDVRRIENSQNRAVIARICRKLWQNRRHLGLVPLTPLLKPGLAGRGFHVGSSLPMSAQPTPSATDLLGRPYGLHRTHIVDASVLPSIPATTITFTVMANAHRIGAAAASLS